MNHPLKPLASRGCVVLDVVVIGGESADRQFVLEFTSASGSAIVWRGSTYNEALSEARSWMESGAQLVDRYARGAPHG